MSGIAGIIHFDGKPVENGQVEMMTSSMAYRGPDGINHWVKGSVALGQCMLCTTTESLEEVQPLTNEDQSLVLVMDGRVDNWEELRKKLQDKGVVLRNRSDAELVIRAFEVWNDKCLEHIDGDFGMVIWDASQKKAFCARDRLGNKPFHYYWNGKTLVFASDLHAIFTLPWISKTLNEGMLAEFLAAEWYSRDETLWKEVMRLVPSHQMNAGKEGVQITQYWAPDLNATLPYTKDEDYIEHYLEIFTDSVKRLSRSHAPVAYDVSGGLDSSAIFCMAEHLRRSNSLPAPSIAGYTLAFNDNSDANELVYAREVSSHLGVPVHEITPSLPPLSWYADRARTECQFPGFPNGAMSLGIRQKAAKQGSRVSLTGDGGDAWLTGSRKYYAEELSSLNFKNIKDCFVNDGKTFGTLQATNWIVRHGFMPLLPEVLKKNSKWILPLLGRGATRIPFWLSPDMLKTIESRREMPTSPSKEGRVANRDLQNILNDAFSDQAMNLNERFDARNGIESRHPMRAYPYVQFAFSTPERLKMRLDSTKYLHVKALMNILPDAIAQRKTKARFSVVFRKNIDHMKEILTVNIPLRRNDWVTKEGMRQLFTVYKKSQHLGWPLWAIWSIYGIDTISQ